MTRKDLPHFEAPPINEVAMGARFAPIEGELLTHFGLFWSLLKGKFGRSEEAMPLGAFEQLAMTKSGAPLPRTWLIHNDEQYLIQLQPNLFFFNWRRIGEAQNYPRYATIKPLFRDYFQLYVEFLNREQLPSPEAFNCDLTYVNIIPTGQDSGVSDGFSGLFPDACWIQDNDRFLPAPKNVTWQMHFDLPDNAGELVASTQIAKRVSDNIQVIRFELTARSTGFKLRWEETEGWFDLAHRHIVNSFVDLTGHEMQRNIWKRIHDAS